MSLKNEVTVGRQPRLSSVFWKKREREKDVYGRISSRVSLEYMKNKQEIAKQCVSIFQPFSDLNSRFSAL